VLPVAGYQVTRDISVGLGLSYELAEEMKKKYPDHKPEDMPFDMKKMAFGGFKAEVEY